MSSSEARIQRARRGETSRLPAGGRTEVTVVVGQDLQPAAIIIGAIAGWLAEKVMKADMGLLMNIIIGILGALLFNWLLSLIMGEALVGWIGSLIAGFIGACILIFLARMVRGKRG